ncbi:MAG: hypothetical protein FWB93_01535 [Oscillospiraceae bacterium]|nr:hypothetical protein [Oscillospiraceae bacterium]
MKNFINKAVNKRTLAFVLTCVFMLGTLVFNTGFILVFENLETARTERTIARLEDSILVEIAVETDGLDSVREIRNLDVFADELGKTFPRMNQYQIGRAVLRAIGDTEEQINNTPIEIVLYATNFVAVETTKSFFMISDCGFETQISENNFLLGSSYKNSDDFNTTTSNIIPLSNQVMFTLRKDIVRARPSATHQNRFQIRAEATWDTLPPFLSRNVDILAIAHTSTANICNVFHAQAQAWYEAPGIRSYFDFVTRDNRRGTFITLEPALSGMAVRVPIVYRTANLRPRSTIALWHGITIQNGLETTVLVSYGHRHLIGPSNTNISISAAGPTVSFSPVNSVTQNWTTNPRAVRWNSLQ